VSLTSELDNQRSPISRYMRERFPNVRDLQQRYREPMADAAPLAPSDAAAVAYPTLGWAFDWRLRFLLTPAPDLHLAFQGASVLGERFRRLAVELFGVLGGTVRLRLGAGAAAGDPDPPAPASSQGRAGPDEERLTRACYALALYTEVFRGGPRPASRLLGLAPGAGLGDLLGLASDAEVADLLALTAAARQKLLPALAARGAPLHIGPRFAGHAHVGGADADVIANGLLVEWKVNLGDRRDGRRRCSLRQKVIHQLLGYLLLDYDDAYRIDALGVYAARYAYLVTWPLGELLEELAGGPVDLANVRTEFRTVVQAAAEPRPTRSSARGRGPRPTRR
jgi:hypothetical protein